MTSHSRKLMTGAEYSSRPRQQVYMIQNDKNTAKVRDSNVIFYWLYKGLWPLRIYTYNRSALLLPTCTIATIHRNSPNSLQTIDHHKKSPPPATIQNSRYKLLKYTNKNHLGRGARWKIARLLKAEDWLASPVSSLLTSTGDPVQGKPSHVGRIHLKPYHYISQFHNLIHATLYKGLLYTGQL